ncbi:hypothetical protein ABGV49_09210 [Chromobacterium vaccinii]|uniref:Uncharacterized protein n=1 Tax=Chromobacterium vaccinii TaxID=1108595 RepID=A0ABV0FAW5_9NEIS
MFVFLLMTFVLFADNSRPDQNLVNLPVKKNTFSALQPEIAISEIRNKSFNINTMKDVAPRYIFTRADFHAPVPEKRRAMPARAARTGKDSGQMDGENAYFALQQAFACATAACMKTKK